MLRKAKKYNSFISKITVEGYKSLTRKLEIELAPMTILAGANSSGKSSIVQPLLLLKQTMLDNVDRGALSLSGPNVNFTSAEQILSKQSAKKKSEKLKISVERGVILRVEKESYAFEFEVNSSGGFELTSMTIDSERQGQFTLTRDMSQEDIYKLFPEGKTWAQERKAEIERNEGFKIVSEGWEIVRKSCFLMPVYFLDYESGGGVEFRYWEWWTRMDGIVSDLIHVPCWRGSFKRTYETAAINTSYPGPFQEYFASIILAWQKAKDEKLETLNRQLKQLMNSSSLRAEAINGTQIELYVNRIPAKSRQATADLINIADAGFGLSQILSILVALLVAKEGQLVYIEEPELHLHPNAQSALASIFADAIKRGVRIVAETHSALLLLGIQTLVAEGKLKPELVKLHWFQRDSKGMTKITSSDLDENGAFDKDWPEDFAEVELKADARYLDAVSKLK